MVMFLLVYFLNLCYGFIVYFFCYNIQMSSEKVFIGELSINPPCSSDEVDFFNRWASTKRCVRNDDTQGKYYAAVVGSDLDGHGQSTKNIVNVNDEPDGQPSLWCEFRISGDGSKLVWSGQEKFYSSPEWTAYIQEHFFAEKALAKLFFPEDFEFLTPHKMSGEFIVYSKFTPLEYMEKISVVDGVIFSQMGELSCSEEEIKHYQDSGELIVNPSNIVWSEHKNEVICELTEEEQALKSYCLMGELVSTTKSKKKTIKV